MEMKCLSQENMFPAPNSQNLSPKIQNQDRFYRLEFLESQLVSVVWYLKSQYKHIEIFIAVKLAANACILLQFD